MTTPTDWMDARLGMTILENPARTGAYLAWLQTNGAFTLR